MSDAKKRMECLELVESALSHLELAGDAIAALMDLDMPAKCRAHSYLDGANSHLCDAGNYVEWAAREINYASTLSIPIRKEEP